MTHADPASTYYSISYQPPDTPAAVSIEIIGDPASSHYLQQLARQFSRCENTYVALLIADLAIATSLPQILHFDFPTARLPLIKIDPSKGKTLKQLEQIWAECIQISPEILIAAGGGTILDLVGFAAATYNRGTAYVSLPTTLLAMVDATVGGKRAIDFRGAKNAIGTIHTSVHSICLLPILTSLSLQDWRGGFAEILKIAMIRDEQLLRLLEQVDLTATGVASHSSALIPDIVRLAIEAKANTIEIGDGPTGLLYGHNVGHALEAMIGLSHGPAVALGIEVEGAIAVAYGLMPPLLFDRQRRLSRRLGLTDQLSHQLELEPDVLLSYMRMYRLATDTHLLFSVPSGSFERRQARMLRLQISDWCETYQAAVAYLRSTNA